MTVSRATLPEEFYDRTSAMLLTQPEPQYLHGTLLKMALNMSLDMGSSMGIMPDRAVGSVGAGWPSPESERLMLSDPIMGEAIKVVAELGKGIGHTVRINRPKFTNSTYSLASREIASGATISTTPVDLSEEQTSVTLKKYGGPYSNSGSAVQPIAVDKLDASVALHSLVGRIGLELKRDVDRALDGFMVSLFDAVASANVIRPAGFSADNDSVLAGDAKFDVDTFFRAEEALDNANIPYFANGKRVAVLHPHQLTQLKGDSQFARYAQFNAEVNPVLQPAFVGSIGKTDVYKSNTLTTAVNSSTITIYYGQMFGPGMVGAGVSRLPEVVSSTSDNYGEQALVVWLMYGGFVTLDNRFGCSLRSS